MLVRETYPNELVRHIPWGENGIIAWRPREGLITQDCRLQTPALGLLHEFGHAYDHLKNPDLRKAMHEMDGPPYAAWLNAEEKHTVEEHENKAARKLGEPERSVYVGCVFYQTIGPTSIIPDPNFPLPEDFPSYED